VSDVFSPAERSRVMAAVRSRGNRSTELLLAALFRSAKITGWRRHYKITGKPDFAFPKEKIAVFVDGCFWHGCPRCGALPASNRAYWRAKIARNTVRDARQSQTLKKRKWRVLRIWEHELKNARRVLRRIQKTLATGDSPALPEPGSPSL